MATNIHYSPKEYLPGAAMAAEALGWEVLSAAYVKVTHIAAATGVKTVLVLGTHYTITGNLRSGAGVITALSAYPALDVFRVERATDVLQRLDLDNQENLPAQDLEREIDRLAMVDEEQGLAVENVKNRALLVGEGKEAPSVSLDGLQDGDLLQFKNGAIQRVDQSQFIGKFYTGGLNGVVPSNGTGADAGLRGDLLSPMGPSFVSFSHANSYQNGTVGGHLAKIVYVTDAPFNAKGDGITDDSAAFLAAVLAASGRLVSVPAGTYKLNSPLNFLALPNVAMHFEEGSVLDFTGMAALSAAITLGGTLSGSFAISGNLAVGATSIDIPGHNFVAGDRIRIVSTDLWNPILPAYIKGEQCIVKSVAGNIVRLEDRLEDSYLAATSSVNKYNDSKVTVTGSVKILRQGNTEGVRIQYANNPRVAGLTVLGARERGIYLLECYKSEIVICNSKASYFPGGGTNYGIVVGSCAKTLVYGGSYNGGRHGVTTGATFPNRDTLFIKVEIDSDDVTGLPSADTHSNDDRTTFVDCNIKNGSNFQGRNLTIRGGSYVSRSYQSGAIIWSPDSVNSGLCTIEPDFVANYAGSTQIWIQPYITGMSARYIRIAPKNILVPNPNNPAASGFISLQGNVAGFTFNCPRVEIDCNAITLLPAASPVYGLSIGAQMIWNGDVFITGSFGGAVENIRPAYFNIVGNIKTENCDFVGSETGGYNVLRNNGEWLSDSDHFNGGPIANARSILALGTGKVHLRNPRFTNLTVGKGIDIPTSTSVLIENPSFTNVSGSYSVPSTHVRSSISALGQSKLYVAAAPTFTHFANGSVAFPINPTVGSPSSWALVDGSWRPQPNVI
jgi:hypothetical protein